MQLINCFKCKAVKYWKWNCKYWKRN